MAPSLDDENDMARRNLDYVQTHLEAVMEEPSRLDDIPEDVLVIFLPEDDDWLLEENLALAKKEALAGHKVMLLAGRSRATAATA